MCIKKTYRENQSEMKENTIDLKKVYLQSKPIGNKMKTNHLKMSHDNLFYF